MAPATLVLTNTQFSGTRDGDLQILQHDRTARPHALSTLWEVSGQGPTLSQKWTLCSLADVNGPRPAELPAPGVSAALRGWFSRPIGSC